MKEVELPEGAQPFLEEVKDLARRLVTAESEEEAESYMEALAEDLAYVEILARYAHAYWESVGE